MRDLPRRDGNPANGKPLFAEMIRAASMVLIGGALAGCASSQQLESWAIPPESPCNSLSASFPLARSTLQSIVGPNFAPAELAEDHDGQLRFTVHACPQAIVSGQRDAGTGFALVSVPLVNETRLLAIAGAEVEDWASLVLYVGPNSGRLSRLLGASAFAVIEGETSLSSQPGNGGERITANIAFENGKLEVSAVFQCEPLPFRRMQVAVGTGSEAYSLLFGETQGRQCSSSDVMFELIGDTPFSDLGLTTEGATAAQASGVTWNYRVLRNAAL